MRRWRTYACEVCGVVVRRRRDSLQRLLCPQHSDERAAECVLQMAMRAGPFYERHLAAQAARRRKPTPEPTPADLPAKLPLKSG